MILMTTGYWQPMMLHFDDSDIGPASASHDVN